MTSHGQPLFSSGCNNLKTVLFFFNTYFHEALFRETYGALKCQHTGRETGSLKGFVLLSLLLTEGVQSRAGLARTTNKMIDHVADGELRFTVAAWHDERVLYHKALAQEKIEIQKSKYTFY